MEALVGAELGTPDAWPKGRVGMLRHYLSQPIPNQMIVMPEGKITSRSWVYRFEADSAYAPPRASDFECVTEGLARNYEWICEAKSSNARGVWTYSLRSAKSSSRKDFVAILQPE